MAERDVIVVGSVNADLVVSVERLPRAGETVTGGTFARHGGGKGANQAVAAARAGATVALVAAVDHGGGADYHPHYHFKFSPGTPKHVGLGLLMVVQDTIASQ
jgi:hypothetical protein